MKKRALLSLFLIIFVILMPSTFAHEVEENFDLEHSGVFPLSQLTVVTYGSVIFGILIFIVLLFQKNMNDLAKKFMYLLVVIVVSLVTIYLILTTLQLNINSVTKGPVHWHADYEIWVCGKEIKLMQPKGLSNMQGVELMHSHNDNRIHVEGILLDKKEASLGSFFHAVGGTLSDDGIKVPTDDGLVSAHDDDNCNEQPAKLYVFVNGKLIGNPHDYAISPYEKVPPGDRIKFVFTEKPVEEINPNIK